MAGGSVAVDMHYVLCDGVSAVRSWAEVENVGEAPQTLDYITSFAYYGVSDGVEGSFEDKMLFDIPITPGTASCNGIGKAPGSWG